MAAGLRVSDCAGLVGEAVASRWVEGRGGGGGDERGSIPGPAVSSNTQQPKTPNLGTLTLSEFTGVGEECGWR